MRLISANLLVCERTLNDADGVVSAIRLVDVFYYTVDTEIPVHKRIAKVALIGMVKVFDPDVLEHDLEFRGITPDGREIKIADSIKVRLDQKIPEAPAGFTILVDFGLVTRSNGTHMLQMILDGEEVARAALTLIERPATPAE